MSTPIQPPELTDFEFMAVLQPIIDQANAKRFELRDFCKRTYPNPMVGMVGLVGELLNLVKLANDYGVDGALVLSALLENGGLKKSPRPGDRDRDIDIDDGA